MKDLHARRPVNNLARTVIDGPSEHHDYQVKGHPDSSNPLPLSPLPSDIENLTGRKCGWLTVVGYHGFKTKCSGRTVIHKWVVRCVCGTYSIRKGQSIRRDSNPNQACERCERIQKLRRGYEK